MARYKDVGPSQSWIHDLAKAEVHPDAERLLHLGKSFDPHQLVEESAVDFLMELREHMNEFARVFNGYSENSGRFQDIKIYSIAQTAADFMMFRNQVKLVVTNPAHGVIQLSFARHVRGAMAVDGQVAATESPQNQLQQQQQQAQQAALQQGQELLAQVGPFRDVFWTFQGEKVSPDQVAKFYFSEFVRATRENRASRASSHLLLEQIKAFLEDKGFDL